MFFSWMARVVIGIEMGINKAKIIVISIDFAHEAVPITRGRFVGQ